jgi:hypothetical protein
MLVDAHLGKEIHNGSIKFDPHWGGASEGFKGTKYRRSLSEKSQEPTIDIL